MAKARAEARTAAAASAGAGPRLVEIAAKLADDVDRLRFAPPVTHVYNPLRYAWEPYRRYLERFGGGPGRTGPGRTVLVGMNPGPFGMAQTGVPFGDVAMVRDWMGITGAVGRPPREHPQRPVRGFDCPRSEVSGTRLWGWAARRFGTADAFFARFLVLNYCPLAFLEESGRNRTPDALPAAERTALYAACDPALRAAVEALAPRVVVGVGRFAADRAAAATAGLGTPIGCILHPSPANPGANRDWEATVERQLAEMGVL
ncbi:MAG TPA: uracil-DNA glycosylase family protein [Thermoanaerobaculia bacterium]|nr:uracil-DNA glycosylase family protein [Thermoanaerobaculia bacterium]